MQTPVAVAVAVAIPADQQAMVAQAAVVLLLFVMPQQAVSMLK